MGVCASVLRATHVADLGARGEPVRGAALRACDLDEPDRLRRSFSKRVRARNRKLHRLGGRFMVHHCHIVNIRGNSYRMRHHADVSEALQREIRATARDPKVCNFDR